MRTFLLVLMAVAAGCAPKCVLQGNWTPSPWERSRGEWAYNIEVNFCDDGTVIWREGGVGKLLPPKLVKP